MHDVGESVTLLFENSWSVFTPFLVADPVALEGGQTRHDASSYPPQIFPLRWPADRNWLYLHVGWGGFADASKKLFDEGPVEHIASSEEQIGVELLFDIHVATIHCLSRERSSSLKASHLIAPKETFP